MTDLTPIGPSGGIEILPGRTTRAMSRSLARLSVRTEMSIRSIEAQADIQSAKVEAVGFVGKRAMFVVSSVTQTEQQLAQMVPLATSRLQAIGDMVAFGAAEIVAETQSKLRRA
jgi:hypothetical protein